MLTFYNWGLTKDISKHKEHLTSLGYSHLLCKCSFICGTAWEPLNDELRQMEEGQWIHNDTSGHQDLGTGD